MLLALGPYAVGFWTRKWKYIPLYLSLHRPKVNMAYKKLAYNDSKSYPSHIYEYMQNKWIMVKHKHGTTANSKLFM